MLNVIDNALRDKNYYVCLYDNCVYVYNYEVIKSIGRNVHETVTFVCDKNGVVKDYIANRKAKSTGNALLKAAGY
mgnify:CR=1 FL=1